MTYALAVLATAVLSTLVGIGVAELFEWWRLYRPVPDPSQEWARGVLRVALARGRYEDCSLVVQPTQQGGAWLVQWPGDEYYTTTTRRLLVEQLAALHRDRVEAVRELAGRGAR